MAERSTKPYLIRAIHEWCSDNSFTPYLSVKVDDNTRVPMEYVKNGQILLNLSYDAAYRLTIGNDSVRFAARFKGVSRECSIPIEAVVGIFARENGQGMFFPPEVESTDTAVPTVDQPSPTTPPPATGGRPKLQVVK